MLPVDDLDNDRNERHREGRGGGSRDDDEVEDLQREVQVLRMQHAHATRQLKGAVAELEVHRNHAAEYKALLELAEEDLCAAHEHVADLSQRLQLAYEGNRRNAEVAQQLLMHLNATRLELKAQACSPAEVPKDATVAKSAATPVRHSARTVLTTVTHDFGVQADLLPASERRATMSTSPRDAANSRTALIAVKHARDLEQVHRELQQRLSPAELQGIALREVRPGSGKASMLEGPSAAR